MFMQLCVQSRRVWLAAGRQAKAAQTTHRWYWHGRQRRTEQPGAHLQQPSRERVQLKLALVVAACRSWRGHSLNCRSLRSAGQANRRRE
jgi:hypothetical protein